jgi:hypothetical protein
VAKTMLVITAKAIRRIASCEQKRKESSVEKKGLDE